jgi:hypothetical protein
MMKHSATVLGVLMCASFSSGAVVKVPEDHKTIPAAVAAAEAGDMILIAQGTYALDSLDVPKTLVLASNYINSKDGDDIDKTIIKAAAKAGKQWFDIRPNAKNTKLIGLTVVGNRNHTLAIHNSYTEVSHCRFIKGKDQLSFEGGGGLVSHCYFEGSGDEPIDADKSLSWTVEYCTFKGSGQDGLEIRLHPKKGPLTTHIVRYNTFLGNRGACIQLVDYNGDSHREFRIYGNIFKNAVNMGLDCTLNSSDGNINGSPMVERAIIFNNTFDGCRNGITMAPGVVVLNNIFTRTGKKGIITGEHLKKGDTSIVDYCLFYKNGSDYDDGLNLGQHIFEIDPQYSNTTSYKLSPGSPAIDKGIATYEWKGTKILDIPKKQYSGKAPDLGAKEMGVVQAKVLYSSIASGLEWGGVAVQEKDYTIWGAAPIVGDDGKVHLFVARWPERNVDPAWRKSSEIAHYVADKPEGPFAFKDVVLTGSEKKGAWDAYAPCNPEIKRFGDTYALLYIGNSDYHQPPHPRNQSIGMVVSKSLDGPWQKTANDGLVLKGSDDTSHWTHGERVVIHFH